MIGWDCPECDSGGVCSVREWRAIYHYRQHISRDAHRIANDLQAHDWLPRANEDRDDVVRRWADDPSHEAGEFDERPRPRYICASCRHVFSTLEVPT